MAETLGRVGVSSTVLLAPDDNTEIPEPAGSSHIAVWRGILSEREMTMLIETGRYCAVVSAAPVTALEESRSLARIMKKSDLPFIRVLKETVPYSGEFTKQFESSEDCAKELRNTVGTILVTTGSKDLSLFCRDEELRKRIVAKVLPSEDRIRICYENGLKQNQIIAITSPVSEELNLALMRQFDVSVLVTNEAGRTGGVEAKLEAAKKLGIQIFMVMESSRYGHYYHTSNLSDKISSGSQDVIREPEYLSYADALRRLEEIIVRNEDTAQEESVRTDDSGENASNDPVLPYVDVTFAGIGMDAGYSAVRAVSAAIAEADLVLKPVDISFGIEIRADVKRFEKVKEAVPELKQAILKLGAGKKFRVVILFSGEADWYAECVDVMQQMRDWVESEPVCVMNTRILPERSFTGADFKLREPESGM